MNSQTRPPPVDHYFSDYAGQQEGSWSQDRYFSTQGSLGGAASDRTEISVADAVKPYPHLTPHPIQGIVAHIERDGTVGMVYGPPLHYIGPNGPEFSLPQKDSRVMVPQERYICGNNQKDWRPKPSIFFSTKGKLGMKLLDAFHERFEGMDGRDDCPFEKEIRGITIRMHFQGYTSSTEVEKAMKSRGEGRKGKGARSMQLATKNYKATPEPVTKSKLVQEVSKRIRWHISDLEANSSIFSFDDRVDQKWRLGQGLMQFDRMMITDLVNVSAGSWSPIIWVE